jgi:hypothetical protein
LSSFSLFCSSFYFSSCRASTAAAAPRTELRRRFLLLAVLCLAGAGRFLLARGDVRVCCNISICYCQVRLHTALLTCASSSWALALLTR